MHNKGLHLLEGQPVEFRNQRLQAVVQAIHKIPKTIPIHLELASVGDLAFLKDIADAVMTEVDSVGLNEQELGALYVATGGTTADSLLAFVAPDVAVVSRAMEYAFNYTLQKVLSSRWLTLSAPPHLPHTHTQHYNIQQQEEKHSSSRLMSRMHFHFLNYHVVATRESTSSRAVTRNWSHGRPSVAAGSVVSARQACDNDDIQLDKVELRMKTEEFEFVDGSKGRVKVVVSPGDSVITEWEKNRVHYYLAPVLVCKKPTKTVLCIIHHNTPTRTT